MNMNDAKRLAELERLAAAQGLSLWQYEAAQTVDDNLLDQLKADARRSAPTLASSPLAAPAETAEEINRRHEEWERQAQRRKEAEEREWEARHSGPMFVKKADGGEP
jgi:hypothetical protein